MPATVTPTQARTIQIKRGLDVPLGNPPPTELSATVLPTRVALLGDDYVGMKPTMHVSVGDRVKCGQLLFEDKKTPGVQFTAPAAGEVLAVNRGAKRKFESLVIQVEGDEGVTFPSFADRDLGSLDRNTATETLISSGLWTALRTRPFGKVPDPTTAPHSIFVTAIDTNPLAPNPAMVIQQADHTRCFVHGVRLLKALTDGSVYVCQSPRDDMPVIDAERVQQVAFDGPHPAGLPGTHIHFLDPVNTTKTVWHVGYQDVIAIGALFLDGQLLTDRYVTVAGPGVDSPRLVRTKLGAALGELTGSLSSPDVRVISGSVLSGRTSVEPVDFLGRYHLQVSVLPDEPKRELLGWAMPGAQRFSISGAYLSALLGKAIMPFTTSTQGSKRAIVPIGSYERVMPLDIIATPLLKALSVMDTDTAQMLGCLELDEEDMALCTFVCPGKGEYGPLLREALTHIEREG